MVGSANRPYARGVVLELGIIALAIVCFVVLDLYVLGCERVWARVLWECARTRPHDRRLGVSRVCHASSGKVL